MDLTSFMDWAVAIGFAALMLGISFTVGYKYGKPKDCTCTYTILTKFRKSDCPVCSEEKLYVSNQR